TVSIRDSRGAGVTLANGVLMVEGNEHMPARQSLDGHSRLLYRQEHPLQARETVVLDVTSNRVGFSYSGGID
ncbi:MAG TPA: hypothetical protein PKE45_19145, partial [Caldilineaceae bacterium]|nr:hypothetical protein [Caldilineaceae bacterium]